MLDLGDHPLGGAPRVSEEPREPRFLVTPVSVSPRKSLPDPGELRKLGQNWARIPAALFSSPEHLDQSLPVDESLRPLCAVESNETGRIASSVDHRLGWD